MEITPNQQTEIRQKAKAKQLNFWIGEGSISITLDETTQLSDLNLILSCFSTEIPAKLTVIDTVAIPSLYRNTQPRLNAALFSTYQSETAMMRYIKRLEKKDLSLTHSMIPLGSCTMKLNAAAQMIPLSWSKWNAIHPFVPQEQVTGYQTMIEELETYLADITGLAKTSLQPNSGAQGELAGLLVIKAYYESLGQSQRNVVLIPTSAHGTNPASATLAGMKVVLVNCTDQGNTDLEDLEKKAAQYEHELAALMVTYPSTHGVFQDTIQDICQIVHNHGGQVYMDGANLNAQVGYTSPSKIGADVCHINLHKTFSIPHGGGGPGMGPICVASHLAPFLPTHPILTSHKGSAIANVSAAPWGSALILIISYLYIRLLGRDGIKKATAYAILNANYIKARLESDFEIVYKGNQGRVAHELIIDLKPFKKSAGIDVIDVAKRLMDYGFHSPTMSWPVPGTMMIEPTESEDQHELDRFCDAMLAIRQEIQAIENGQMDPVHNVLKNAPHTIDVLTQDNWPYSYTRKSAAFPLDYVHLNKFWPSVGRVNDAHGDRHLICSCQPMDAYAHDSQEESQKIKAVSRSATQPSPHLEKVR